MSPGASKSHVFMVHFCQDSKKMISVANCLMDNDFNVSIYKQEQFLSLEKENLMKIQKLFNEVRTYESSELLSNLVEISILNECF